MQGDADPQSAEFAERVRNNQAKLTAELKTHYDFVVCGSGSSGSVVARRLAENPAVSVLLLEAGGTDEVAAIMDANQWFANLESERKWNFRALPNPHLNCRSLPLAMGRVLGGGSSINAMIWARGHQSDWDFYAAETDDPAWNYESVLSIYRRIEDWHGAPDPKRRGTGGLVFVQPAVHPNPLAPAVVEGARTVGITTFQSNNGVMMEGDGGAALLDLRVRNGKRLSVFRTYAFPYMDRPNLTVVTDALVTQLTFTASQVTGVEMVWNGHTHYLQATCEVVLSLGAINTPKILMQSGIGDEEELQKLGIPIVEHLPGVGRNFQDHIGFNCLWEFREAVPLRNNGGEATVFAKSHSRVHGPDLQIILAEFLMSSPENIARFGLPPAGWGFFGTLVRPKSRGRIRLSGSSPVDPVQIESNFLSDPDDLKAARACVELCRQIGNSQPLSQFNKREIMPGALTGKELDDFIRNAALTVWHQSGTAKMGRDSLSVVDSHLRVYGIQRLRIADGSVMPRVTTGNTMATCVVIGERAADMIREEYGL